MIVRLSYLVDEPSVSDKQCREGKLTIMKIPEIANRRQSASVETFPAKIPSELPIRSKYNLVYIASKKLAIFREEVHCSQSPIHVREIVNVDR